MTGWQRRPFHVVMPARVKLCMARSTLFTAEMVCRYGGDLVDTRRDLDRLARAGLLVKRSQRRGVDFYHRKH
jgi:hypothetical protein